MFPVTEEHVVPADVKSVYRESDGIVVGQMNDGRWFVKRHNNIDPTQVCASFDQLVRGALTARERRSIGL